MTGPARTRGWSSGLAVILAAIVAAPAPAAAGPPAAAAQAQAAPVQAAPVQAAPVQAAPVQAAPPPATAPEDLISLPAGAGFTVLGRTLEDKTGQDIGRLVDILANPAGQPLAAVVDVGGFLGVGTRRIAVEWAGLHFTADAAGPHIVVELDGDAIIAAPEYHNDQPAQILRAPHAAGP